MNNIILFCHQRSGSSKLVNNYHRNYKNHYSFDGLYDPEMLKGPESFRERPWFFEWLKKYNSTFSSDREAVRKAFFDTLTNENHILFKHFFRMESMVSFDELLSMKDELGLTFVSLKRDDIIKSALSFIIAKVSNIWLIDSQTQVDTDEFKDRYVNLSEKILERKQFLLPAIENDIIKGIVHLNRIQPYMDLCLTYEEDIVTDNYIAKLGLANEKNLSDFKQVLFDQDFERIKEECPWLIEEITKLAEKYNLSI